MGLQINLPSSVASTFLLGLLMPKTPTESIKKKNIYIKLKEFLLPIFMVAKFLEEFEPKAQIWKSKIVVKNILFER